MGTIQVYSNDEQLPYHLNENIFPCPVCQLTGQSGTGNSWRMEIKSLWSFTTECMDALELCQTSIPALDLNSSENK